MTSYATARHTAERETRDPIRLLIADDDEGVREELGSYLESEGFEIVGSVSDGLQAFEQAAWLRPDVVLMDLHMPNMDGISATNIIKSHSPEIPVVILTAFSERDNRWASQLAGAASFLDKSTPMTDLVEVLRSAVRGPR
jgi:DNA-binding NarL/FixJ family response regulator